MLIPVWLFVTPQTIARQAPLSMGIFRQEYWSELPFSPPGDLPDPGIEPEFLFFFSFFFGVFEIFIYLLFFNFFIEPEFLMSHALQVDFSPAES